MDGLDLAHGSILRLHSLVSRGHVGLGVLRAGGSPRRGILGLDTTRGDRLFISLLGSAYIFLAWLGIMGPPLWGGLALALVWVFFVFKWV